VLHLWAQIPHLQRCTPLRAVVHALRGSTRVPAPRLLACRLAAAVSIAGAFGSLQHFEGKINLASARMRFLATMCRAHGRM
jgi:hypothetical protein